MELAKGQLRVWIAQIGGVYQHSTPLAGARIAIEPVAGPSAMAGCVVFKATLPRSGWAVANRGKRVRIQPNPEGKLKGVALHIPATAIKSIRGAAAGATACFSAPKVLRTVASQFCFVCPRSDTLLFFFFVCVLML